MITVRTFIVGLGLTALTIGACERRHAEATNAPEVGGAARASETVPPRAKAESIAELTLEVDGMVCQGCVADVREVLMAVPGVVDVNVTLETKRVVVKVDAKNPPEAAGLCRVLIDAGHEARVAEAAPKKS